MIGSLDNPELCVMVRKKSIEATNLVRGPFAKLLPCSESGEDFFTTFFEAADGTMRAVEMPNLCLRTGTDRPQADDSLRLEPCTNPMQHEQNSSLAFVPPSPTTMAA